MTTDLCVPSKCTFLQKKLEYLGHETTPEGIKPLQCNVETIINFPQPQNKKELERFIGLASYHRKFISNFVKQTHNLNRLKMKNQNGDWKSEYKDSC